ncbi:MAG: 4Fe-4S binding protein, partial [Gammaproteobacteria bacterium]|nr:4Fe-4S binding protein [Gammaproteobacteria bacterium]
MLNLTEAAIRLYRQIFGSPEFAGQLADGIETVLDGNTAIAVTEACITEVAALGGGFLQQGAALAWLSEQQRVRNNLFDEKLSIQYADSPRGALASAMGVTLSGHRSTVFLAAHDLSACQDLLQTAVGRRLPLVIHLDNRLSATHSNSPGSGHDALHQLMDSGCFVLFAENVQQAVDFTLIARHVAELTLTPGIVVVDGTETALAVQDVRLPSAELVKLFIGAADEAINSPSVAQKQLFSEQRNRVHRWHDLDKPVLQGALQTPEIYALGNAAREIYFEDLVANILEQAFAEYAQLTARKYSSVSSFGLKKADIIIVAQGSAIETVRTLSTYLKGLKEMNIGVIGLHSLRPFNASQLIDILQKNKSSTQQLIILERMTVPLADDAPLMREIRAAIHKKLSTEKGTGISDFPQLRSIIYGLGGVSLNLEDLWVLCQEIKNSGSKAIASKANVAKGRYLGVPFVSYDVRNARSKTKEDYPKRQVMLDTLVRYYPQISELGINAKGKGLSVCSAAGNAISFAISHMSDGNDNIAYALDLSASLHKLKGGYLRSSISSSWEQWATRQTDYITQADQPYNAGSSSLVDFFMVISADEKSLLSACQQLAENGVLIYTDNLPDSFSSESILEECIMLIQDNNITLHKVDTPADNDIIQIDVQWEKILATLIASLFNNNQLNIKQRKVVSIRESLINAASEEKKTSLTEIFKETLDAIIENSVEFDNYQMVLSDSVKIANTQLTTSAVPEMVKKLGQASESYDSLPRFWDQVGVLLQADESDQLTADPYLATGTIPSLSATFNDMSRHRHTINGADFDVPVFNPQKCTACGACWANCPDSAIAVVAITPKALIETGINMSGADALRSVTAKLASRMAKRCRNNEIEANNAGELISDAFDWFKEKSGLPEERMLNIETDFEKVHLAIADLPVVTTELLFYSQEKRQNDSGELFSLIINPDSCKGCGLCVELCDSITQAGQQNSDAEQNQSSALT